MDESLKKAWETFKKANYHNIKIAESDYPETRQAKDMPLIE